MTNRKNKNYDKEDRRPDLRRDKRRRARHIEEKRLINILRSHHYDALLDEDEEENAEL